VQRVPGLGKGTHVEIDDGGPLWYGQVVEAGKDHYRIRIGGTERVVTVPESDVDLHPVPRRMKLQKNLKSLAGGTAVLEIIQAWARRKKPVHDPFRTLELMVRAHLLSKDSEVQELAEKGDLESVSRVVATMENQVGRQLVQSWDDLKPEVAIKQLGLAWPIFVDGIKALEKSATKLDLYLDKCLAHDKGYAQTLTATQTYIFLQSEKEDLDFEAVMLKALGTKVNMNLWVGGMKGSGVIRDQLKTGPVKEHSQSAEQQEETMWTGLIAPIVNARSEEQDWTYLSTIKENRKLLFKLVQDQVGVKLHPALLDKVLELL